MAAGLQYSIALFILCLVSQQIVLHASHPVSVKEIRANFLQWVDRVGTTAHGKQSVVAGDQALVTGEQSLASSEQSSTVDGLLAQSEQPARVITVNQEGSGDFKSIQDAVDSVEEKNTQRVIIQVAAGTYKEKVKIPKKKGYITLQGAKDGQTVVTWHDNAKKAGSTLKSATMAVMSDHFIATDMTFVNTAPYPKPGSTNMQAVAFQISGDKGALYNCKFYSTQDTLYDHKGRHYFYNCFIQGSVDFIFGGGLSLYESCNLHAIAKSYGSFSAQKRKTPSDDSGFSFVNCKMSGSGVLYLSRAWGPYARVVFITSYIDAQIAPGGFNNWNQPKREKTAFFGTYKCSGPGANIQNRVAWSYELTEDQASPFMSLGFVGGSDWVSQVP